MSESEMKLSERSEFFISGSAFNQILRPLFFLQFRNGSRFPHPSPPSCAIWQAPDIFGYFSTDAPFGKSELNLRQLQLSGIQLIIRSFQLEQFFMRTSLYDTAVFKYHDRITVPDCGQSVGNNKYSTSFHKVIHDLLDNNLSPGIN